MKLYFGNTVTIITTIMILVLLGFIVESIVYRNKNLGYVREIQYFRYSDKNCDISRNLVVQLIKGLI